MSRWLLHLKNRFSLSHFLTVLIVAASVVNLIGAFGPEVGFDALWYHLTMPKLWLMWGKITFIPGGLLYYSAMPRLGEFLFLLPLKYFSDIGPHLVNWLFGIGAGVITYKLARKFLNHSASLLAVSLFYVTPLVGWQSGSGYIDLIRTFFEVTAVFFLLSKKNILAGLMIGLAISTKTLAFGSLPILMIISIFLHRDWKGTGKLFLTAIVVSAPWFIYAYLKTGFPFYPIGAGFLDSSHRVLPGIGNLFSLAGDYFKLFLAPEDFLSPVFVIFIPILFVAFRKFKRSEVALIIYWLLSFLVWWATPRTGGGRFLLPFLPVWSVLVVLTISHVSDRFVKVTALTVVILSLGINFIFRFGSVARLAPYLLSRETKTAFLCRHLDFKTSVFVDCDGWFKKNIKETDLVLTSSIHNLFYVNFPFVDATWYQDENYSHILVPTGVNPQSVNFKSRALRLIHEDRLVGVSLYAASDIQYAWR